MKANTKYEKGHPGVSRDKAVMVGEIKPKIVLAGGTGFLGGLLAERFKHRYAITVLSRSPSRFEDGINYVQWNARTLGDWKKELEGAQILINLTGKSVDCRFTDANRKLILNSRIESTKVLADAVQKVSNPPALWINAAGASIYSPSRTNRSTEEDESVGDSFMAQVSKQWEDVLFSSNESLPDIRKVALRISLILGASGGVAPKLFRFSRLFLGGSQGSGKQMMSWMHAEDFVSAVEFIINNKGVSGPVNMASPQAVNNKEFMKALRKAVKRPFGFPAPTPVLRLAAALMGSEPELVLTDMNVYPEKLLDFGFHFRYPEIKEAVNSIVGE